MRASFASNSYNPDRLVAGDFPLLTEAITLLSGENRTRATLLGKQTTSTVPTTGTAGGGNTGNGTMGSVAAGGTDLQAGTYTARCVKVVANAGDFEIVAPDGSVIGIATTAVAYTSSHLDLTIADGSTDFALGDTFTIAVTGSGKFKMSLAAATDGSQTPVAVLSEDTDASAADVASIAYFQGEFDENEIVFGTGHTAASVRDALRDKGVRLVPSLTP
jgi:Bacteriophage lambda head decoration protein D